MLDERLKTLAKRLVTYSVSVKKGEKVLIQAFDCDPNFIARIVDEIYLAGGIPFTQYSVDPIGIHVSRQATKEYYECLYRYRETMMKEMDCKIQVIGSTNKFNGKSVPHEINKMAMKVCGMPLHEIAEKSKNRWVLLNFPSSNDAQEAGMETEEFEDYFFEVCNFDYSKMFAAMEPLAKLMAKADKVRIIAPETDLSFSIKGIGSHRCAGTHNIPDGEVFTAPVKGSMNGTIKYNVPFIKGDGKMLEDIKLTFKDGKVVEHECSDKQALTDMLDTDEGSRFVGEFAFGLNPHIKKPMRDILFDEKIACSIHLALGHYCEETPNGNKSAVHADMIQIQTPEYGGGEIYLDDVLVRKDGRFVIKELLGLNPENLVKI